MAKFPLNSKKSRISHVGQSSTSLTQKGGRNKVNSSFDGRRCMNEEENTEKVCFRLCRTNEASRRAIVELAMKG